MGTRKLARKIDDGLSFVDSISSGETLQNLLLNVSPVVAQFFQTHPSFMGLFLTVVVFLIFWRKKSKTVVEKLLIMIDNNLDSSQISGLVKSKNFQIIFPQIFEALVKEVSEKKAELFLRYFKNLIKNPEGKPDYQSKIILALLQMTPEEFDFLSIFYGVIQREWVKRNKKIGMTLGKAEGEVWRANNAQLNFALKGKYSDEKLYEIIDSLHSRGIIRGTMTYNGYFGMNGITEFGKFFMEYLKP